MCRVRGSHTFQLVVTRPTSLDLICESLGIDRERLLASNPSLDSEELEVGQELVVPAADVDLAAETAPLQAGDVQAGLVQGASSQEGALPGQSSRDGGFPIGTQGNGDAGGRDPWLAEDEEEQGASVRSVTGGDTAVGKAAALGTVEADVAALGSVPAGTVASRPEESPAGGDGKAREDGLEQTEAGRDEAGQQAEMGPSPPGEAEKPAFGASKTVAEDVASGSPRTVADGTKTITWRPFPKSVLQ